MEVVSGEIKNIRLGDKDNGYMVADIKTDEGKMMVVVGTLFDPHVRFNYEFTGAWANSKWGWQFKFAHCRLNKPDNENSLIAYLKEYATWIGPKRAKLIYAAYGKDSLSVLKNEPERVVDDISGITMDRAKELSKKLVSMEDMENVLLELNTLAGIMGLSNRAKSFILKMWGEHCVEAMRENPYGLIDEVPGVGFLSADKLGLYLNGGNSFDPERVKAAILYTLQEDAFGRGNICMPVSSYYKRTARLLGHLGPEHVYTSTQALITEEDILAVGDYVYLKKYYDQEQLIRRVLVAKASTEFIAATRLVTEGLGDDQAEALEAISTNGVFVLTGAPGTGKAQPLDSKVLGINGWRTMGSLRVGSKVANSDGKFSAVTAIHPQGKKAVYRVIFSDDSTVECTKDHLWKTARRDRRKRHKNNEKVYSINSLAAIKSTLVAPGGASNHSIPMIKPIQFPKRLLPIDPYLLGILLGDGILGPGLMLSNADVEILEYVKSTIHEKGLRLVHRANNDFGISRHNGVKGKNFLREALRFLGLWGARSWNKFIPEIYLVAPIKDRLALLCGLMDTDGSTSKNHAEFSTVSRSLAEGIQFLIESLGGTAKIVLKPEPKYTYNGEQRIGRPCYRVGVVLSNEFNPFRLKRKADRYIPKTKYQPRRIIRDTEYAGRKECQCISVDSPDGLYVTDHCVLTHNTYLLKRILQAFPGADFALAAPTGKAAKRMTEQTGSPAMTIHRLLEPQPTHNGFVFTRNAENPIEADIIILDEMSMVDVPLMASLLDAVSKSAKLILVGDHHQLPPVGPGSVLLDAIKSTVIPTTELTQIKRQEEETGDIIKNCHRIKNGQNIIANVEDTAIISGLDFYVVNLQAEEAIRDHIIHLVSEQLPRRFPDLDPLVDIQVITPHRQKHSLSCDGLNPVLQSAINQGEQCGSSIFRVGDKVIQTKNDYKLEIINGDIGIVLAYEKKEMTVKFDNPDRELALDIYDNDLQLAYALTVHKFQGSEAPIIVIPIHSNFSQHLLHRNLLYTAISRAQKLCILVGHMNIIPAIISRQQKPRHTNLASYLYNDLKGED